LLFLLAHAIFAEQVEHGHEQTVQYQRCHSTEHTHTQSKKQNSIRELETKRARRNKHAEIGNLCKQIGKEA